MKSSFLRKISGPVISGMVVASSLSSALAATDVTRVTTVDLNNSCVNTIVSQSDSRIATKGGEVSIADISVKSIKDSIVGTGVFEGKSTIKVKGKNVKVTSADELDVDGSYVDMLVNDVKSKIKTYSR